MTSLERVKHQASVWAQVVGDWVGDSPWKATTFGVACFLLGGLWGGAGFWPL